LDHHDLVHKFINTADLPDLKDKLIFSNTMI